MLLRILMAAATLALAAPARASVVVGLDLPELTGQADVVVRGRAVAQAARWDDAHTRIYTDVTFVVEQTYKGAPRPGEPVVITRLGGSVGGIGMRVYGEATFATGEEAIVFLRRAPGGRRLSVVGMGQGKLTVLRDARGARVLRSAGAAGVRLVAPDATGRIQRRPAAPSVRPLAEVERDLAAAVKARAPRRGTVRP
jgi:hypothetical protein